MTSCQNIRVITYLVFTVRNGNLLVFIIKTALRRKTTHVVIAKLVVAASAYFIWQERNWRLFKKSKRSIDQVVSCISSSVRMKLLSCAFKRTTEGVLYARLWDLPNSIFR
ncbi:hypothetical protein Tco_0353160 [Tanacetum coccineum]